MKKINLIFIIIYLILGASCSFAVDYYPELGIDPFYSSLNPTYVDEDSVQNEEDTLFGLFKKNKQKFNNKNKDNEQKKEEIKKENLNEKKEVSNNESPIKKQIDKNIQDSSKNSRETFVYPEKKPLTKKELEKELLKEEKEKQKQQEAKLKEENPSLSFKDRLFFFRKKKETPVEDKKPEIELTADYMEYFPERYEVEAIGNAKVNFVSQNTSLSANKIIFNYDKNILKANENVVLTSKESVTEGDFVKIDLNNPDGWIENPSTKANDIKLTAKEAFIYSDRIEEYDGVAKILSDETLRLGSTSFAGYVDQSRVLSNRTPKISDESKGVYNIKARTIYIDSRDDHEVITIKNADLYLKNYKIAVIPSIRVVTNKQRASIETNFPEIGSQSMLGSHIGPAVVLNVPGGSTLKLAPILTYKDEKVGIGGIARFRNQYNMTEVAYGTSRDELVIRGRHKLAPGLLLNYSRLTNQNEWFLGYRMPKYSAQLSYARFDYVKDLKLNFSQLYSAGVFVDRRRNVDFGDAEGRFRWMTQTYKPVYKYSNEEGNIGFNVGLIAQTAATVYTTGDVLGLFRVGPALNTKVGPWKQSLIYYQTATGGQSPFAFDRYRYGRSNVVLIESLKICKYLTVGYLASLAMNRDVKSDDLFQENRILVSVGPEYAKVTIGYDSIRRNTMLIFSMLVGTKDSDIEFKKTVLKNPEKFGKEKSKQHKKSRKKSYKKYLKETV